MPDTPALRSSYSMLRRRAKIRVRCMERHSETQRRCAYHYAGLLQARYSSHILSATQSVETCVIRPSVGWLIMPQSACACSPLRPSHSLDACRSSLSLPQDLRMTDHMHIRERCYPTPSPALRPSRSPILEPPFGSLLLGFPRVEAIASNTRVVRIYELSAPAGMMLQTSDGMLVGSTREEDCHPCSQLSGATQQARSTPPCDLRQTHS